MREGEQGSVPPEQQGVMSREVKDTSQGASVPSHKERERLRADIQKLLWDVRAKDTAQRLPNGTIAELLLSPDLSPTDRRALVDAIQARLELSGMRPSERGVDALATGYQRLLAVEQKQLDAVDLAALYRDRPDVQVDPSIPLKPGGRRESITAVVNGRPAEFKLEMQEASRDALSFLIVDDSKGHDALGVARNPDGTLAVAVADGVSGGVVPQIASRLAVRVGLDEQRTTSTLQGVFSKVFEALQETDVSLLARKYIQNLETTRKTILDPTKAATIGASLDRLKELFAKGQLSGTTLGVVRYDRDASRLQLALKSDTSVRIFHTDGTVTPYQNPDMSQQLHYDRNPNAAYSHVAETIRDVPLASGDLILVHTDGLKDDVIQELSTKLLAMRTAGQRLDAVATREVRTMLSQKGVSDDVTAVFVYHQ